MDMNRREFLRTAGKAALGAVAVSSLPLPVMAEGKEAPVWPWKYVPLDKDALLKRCYEKFYEYGGCGGGCFGGIIDIMIACYGVRKLSNDDDEIVTVDFSRLQGLNYKLSIDIGA